MRERVQSAFETAWREVNDEPPPELIDDTVLLDTGLDSLGFAVVVTRLEEEHWLRPVLACGRPLLPADVR